MGTRGGEQGGVGGVELGTRGEGGAGGKGGLHREQGGQGGTGGRGGSHRLMFDILPKVLESPFELSASVVLIDLSVRFVS